MNVEQALTDELRAVADLEAPPPPPAAELILMAEHERTRTRMTKLGGTALVAAAVVAAIVIGSQIGRPEAAPPPTHPTGTATDGALPTGAPPRIPYVLRGVLYIGGHAQSGQWSGVTTAGRTSLAYFGAEGSDSGALVVFHNGVEATRLTKPGSLDAILSPNGTVIAWIEHGADSATLVLYDVETGLNLGRLPLSPTQSTGGEETEGWESLEKVTDDGTVTYGSVLVTHTWEPGSAPVDQPAQSYDGIEGYPDSAGYVMVRPDGVWGAWQTDRTGDPAPGKDGEGPLDGVTVQRPGEPASRFTIALPVGSDGRRIEWETTNDVLVTVFEDRDGFAWHYLRCNIIERQCEQVPTTPAE